MTSITLQTASPREVTVLTNDFIDNYMPRANGEFVKVYIHLLRLLSDGTTPFSLEQMADHFFCTERDILRALKYWEKEKLLILNCQDSGEISCITLTEPKKQNKNSILPAPEPTPDSAPASVSSLTPDRVKELKQNDEIVQLLYITEQYLGKTLTPTEVKKIMFFYDELHFSPDLIEYLIEYSVSRGHKSIRYIETVALAWAKEGISTVTMAKETNSQYNREYYIILKAMGITNRNPVESEIVMMDTWLKDYGFSMDMIQEACSRTIMQTGQPSFQYAHKILTGWFKKSALTPEAVHALDVQHQKRSQDNSRGRSQTPKSPNRFNNFQQRNYDFKELEKQLLERQNPYSQQPH